MINTSRASCGNKLTSFLRDSHAAAQNRLSSRSAQANDEFRLNNFYFRLQPWPACHDLAISGF